MANLEFNQTFRDTLASGGGLFGVNSTSDTTPSPYSRLAITRASAMQSSTVTLTANAYTTVAADIGGALNVTTGATDATITLLPAATAGANTEMVLRKADVGLGMVIVMDGSSTPASTLCWLQAANDRVWLRSNGLIWEIIAQTSNTPLDGVSYVDGRYYPCAEGIGSSAAVSAVDTIYFFPFPIWETVKIQKLGMRITSAGAASSAFKSAIYRSSPTASGAQVGRPYGAPLVVDNTGQAATSIADVSATISPAVTIFPGMYWSAVKFTSSSTLPSAACHSLVSNGSRFIARAGGSTLAIVSTGGLRSFSLADAYANNMPTISSSQSFTEMTSGNSPILCFQASVP